MLANVFFLFLRRLGARASPRLKKFRARVWIFKTHTTTSGFYDCIESTTFLSTRLLGKLGAYIHFIIINYMTSVEYSTASWHLLVEMRFCTIAKRIDDILDF
jgi:hypothetical protein